MTTMLVQRLITMTMMQTTRDVAGCWINSAMAVVAGCHEPNEQNQRMEATTTT
jgi:hypothetical protein